MAAASESSAASSPVVRILSGARRFVFFGVIFIGRVAVPSYILKTISSFSGQRKRPDILAIKKLGQHNNASQYSHARKKLRLTRPKL
jgi:hypothetical protein